MTDQPTEPNATDDAALIRRYAEQGDHEALGELFRRYSDFAFRTACRVLRNPSEAEDAVQAAFVLMMRGLHRGQSVQDVRGWVAAGVVNAARNMIRTAVRRRNREERYVEEEEIVAAADPEFVSPVAQQVKAVLDKLPEKYRLPVWLHHHEGMAFQAIARTLRLSEGTVRSQASRGLAMLRQTLARSGMAVSSMALLDLLPTLPGESVPASLAQSLASLAESGTGAFAGRAGSGARMAGSLVPTSSSGLKPLALGALALGAVGLGAGLLYYARQTPPVRTEPAVLSSNNKGLPFFDDFQVTPLSEWRWDFDDEEWPTELKALRGDYLHRHDGGVGNSGCIETGDGEFEMLFDVPISRFLPILVSFDKSQYLHSPGAGHTEIVWPLRHGPLAIFQGLSDAPPVRIKQGERYSPFVATRMFVSKDIIVSYSLPGPHLHTIIVGELLPDESGDIRLFLHVRGRLRIDNLSIRSLSPEDDIEMPDIAPYLDALSRIEPERRKGTVPVPELKPGRYASHVSIGFHRAGSTRLSEDAAESLPPLPE